MGGGARTSPIDDLRESLEMAAADRPSEEKRASNRAKTATDLWSVVPVVGNAMSAEDAVDAYGDAWKAFQKGDVKKGAVDTGVGALNTLGAVTGLPWGKAAGQAAKGGSSRLNIFAGPEAKTADKAALDRAQEMRRAGKSPDEIWRETGWAWDEARGQPYFEISDDAAKLMPGQAQNVGQAIDHPALKAAYPDIVDMRFSPESAPANSGAYYRGGKGNPERIALGPGSDATRLNMALHELQHGVQTREAFAPGASAAGYMVERGIDRDQARRLYRRTAGEVQARNVEARRSMTPEERRATAPWKTQDTPEHEVYYPSSLHERQDVFVPVEEGKLTERARDMRERGASNEAVYDTTGLNFGPDGTIRRRIPDNRMDIDMSFDPGDVTTVGALVNHPTLFREMPDLQNRIVKVTDKAEMRPGSPMPRGITRTDPETGNFEFSKASADPYADMAKLLQYDINDRVGFSSAGRHMFGDQMADLWKAQLRATQSGADRKAIEAYVDAIERVKGDVSADLGKIRNKDISRKLTDRDAGSTDAKIVRGEADLRGGFGYPYAKNASWLKGYWTPQDFRDLTVLPPKGATLEDMAQFIEDWKRYGAGAGN